MNFLTMFLRGIALMPSIIQGVESLFGAKTGDQKKSAVLSVVTSAINVTDAVANKTIVDAEAFTAALGTIIDGIVACLNASIWHTTSTSTTTATAASGTTTAA